MPVYRTAPFASPGTPPGIPFIVANEAAERCSGYGMRVILAVHMVRTIQDEPGCTRRSRRVCEDMT